MPRPDLLALTPDDLGLLANVGLVKRARRELEGERIPLEAIAEAEDGTVTVRWADASCTLPAGKVITDGRCDCRAVSICRHLIRSVLAYQRWAQATEGGPEQAGEAARPAPEPWDPGTISDEDLARSFTKAALTRARRQLERGLLVELVRSAKPTARFHGLSFTVRFMVPGDVRYTKCDCDEQPPCRHAPLAVWAFRRLPRGAAGGYVSTQEGPLAPPLELLDALEAEVRELVSSGVSGLAPPQRDRLRRLQRRCTAAALIWPAEVLGDLALQLERYQGHDARFSPGRVAALLGELLVRCDAVRSDTGVAPQLLVRGASSDRAASIGSTRFVGLGCGVRLQRRAVELSAYLQDVDSGSVVAVCRDFLDPPADDPEPPKDYAVLARRAAVQGVSLAALGEGQLLVQGARREASHRLTVGRRRASFNPQTYAWEALRAPVLAESFAEVRARLTGMPPASLRPRRVAEDFHVCPVAAVEHVEFVAAEQEVQAALVDSEGGRAWLVHPYTSRGAEGTEALLALLRRRPQAVRYVAGPVRAAAAGLVASPVAVVFDDGEGRRMLQPWVARPEQVPGEGPPTGVQPADEAAVDPVGDFPARLGEGLAELLLLGLQRVDASAAAGWQDLLRQGEALGFNRLLAPVERLAAALDQRTRSARWDAAPAVEAALELLVMVRIGQELGW